MSARCGWGTIDHGASRVLAARLEARLIWIALVSSIAPVSGCMDIHEPPGEEPTITGVITRVEAELAPRRILIEERPEVSGPGPEVAGAKIWFSVDGTSIWVERADGRWGRGTAEDLRVGSMARAWTNCGGLDSYPGQACAGDIAIITAPTR